MERQQIPSFPTGDRSIESVEYGTEGVHPRIGSLYAVSEGEERGVQKIFPIIFSVIAEIDIGNDPHTLTLSSEVVTVKTGIRIDKESINRYSGIAHHAEKLIQRISNFVDIMVLTGFRFGYCDWNTLTVRDKDSIGRVCCFVGSSSDLLASTTGDSMAAVKVGTGQIELVMVAAEQCLPTFLPRTVLAPLPKLPENCFITGNNFGKDCLGGYQMPLTTCLELIQDALDDLAKVSLAYIASLGGCQIRQDFHSYGVFVNEFYQFKECLGVFLLITLNTPFCIFKISQDDFTV